MSWIYITANTTLTVNERYLISTSSSPLELLLDETAVSGDEIFIADGEDFSQNSVTIKTGNNTFSDNQTEFVVNEKGAQYQFIFDGNDWLIFNISRRAVKISELSDTSESEISDDDLLLYINDESGILESQRIRYQLIRDQILKNLSDDNTKLDQLVTSLNTRTTADVLPRLNVTRFNNQAASHYLNYNNLTNRPFIPTKTSDIQNDSGFLTNSFFNTTTDNLPEGQTNLYFTEERFDSLFDDRFVEKFREFSGDLDEPEIADSLEYFSCPGQTAGVSTNILQIPSVAIRSFFPDQTLRVYGSRGSASVPAIVTNLAISSPTVSTGLTQGSTPVDIRYRIVEFSYETGRILGYSPETPVVSINSFQNFNLENNISFLFSRSSSQNGILIYRKINSNNYVLIAALGNQSSQLGNAISGINFVDYGGFDATSWSGKNIQNGNYTSEMELQHFPLSFVSVPSSPEVSEWTEVVVDTVDVNQSRIILKSNIIPNSVVYITQDDTIKLQTAINSRIQAGINFLTLNSRQYNVKSLLLPNTGNFVLFGRGQKTVLKKISWTTSDNRILLANVVPVNSMQIENLVIDGNYTNQVLIAETSSNPFRNYAVDLRGDSNRFLNVTIRNVIGGGIRSDESTRFLFSASRIENSGISDRYDYNPISIELGDDVVVTNSVFRNFSSSINMKQIDNGVFSSNIIENCGSGVEIFGSRFFISSPNIIKGPANEFIPGPDIFNSDFDRINIQLTRNADYNSDVYVYQQDGIIVDLTTGKLIDSTDTSQVPAAQLIYSMFALKKEDNVEQLYREIFFDSSGTPVSPIENNVSVDPTQGQFKFRIVQSNVNRLLDNYSFSKLKGVSAVFTGSISGNTLTVTNVASGNINIDDVIQGQGIPNDVSILSFGTGTGNTGTYTLSRSIGTVSSIGISTVKDLFHTSLVYQVALREYPRIATVNTGTRLNNTDYQIVVPTSSLGDISTGSSVILLNHDYASTDGAPPAFPSTDSLVANVQSINILGQTTQIVLRYSSNIFSGFTNLTGTGGTLHIQNTYILAKGKVQ
jgi:hypothetical protein